jgi:hypothetical protein
LRRRAWRTQRAGYLIPAVALLCALQAGCASPDGALQETAPLPTDTHEFPPAPPGNARLYRIVAAESDFRILVRRTGPLARLGHNHVVSPSAMSGSVAVADPLDASRVTLVLPVDRFLVDDPAERTAAGAEFDGTLDAAAIAGTRANMLGPAVLDAKRWPDIVIAGAVVGGTRDAPLLDLRVTLHGVTRFLRTQPTLAMDEARLTAKGRAALVQSDFGMQPFGVLLGALRIEDRLVVDYRLSARRDD